MSNPTPTPNPLSTGIPNHPHDRGDDLILITGVVGTVLLFSGLAMLGDIFFGRVGVAANLVLFGAMLISVANRGVDRLTAPRKPVSAEEASAGTSALGHVALGFAAASTLCNLGLLAAITWDQTNIIAAAAVSDGAMWGTIVSTIFFIGMLCASRPTPSKP